MKKDIFSENLTDEEYKRLNELWDISRKDEGFATYELAAEFGSLRKKSWGSNLVLLGIEQNSKGLFNQTFNLWD